MKITGDSLNYSSMLLLKCDTQACSRSQLRAQNWDKLKQYGCLSTTSLFSWPQSKNLKNPKCLSHVIELYPGLTHEYCNLLSLLTVIFCELLLQLKQNLRNCNRRCRVNVQEGQRSGGGQRSGRVNVQEGQHSGEGQRSGGGQRSGRGQHCGGQDRVNILGVNI